MREYKLKKLLPIILLIITGCEKQPSTYEECIFKEMKGVDTDIAAYSIRTACKEKFKEQNPFDQFDKNNQNKPSAEEFLNNVSKTTKIQEYIWQTNTAALPSVEINAITSRNTIKVTNKSAYNIDSVTLGKSNTVVCTTNKSSYSELIGCSYYSYIAPDSTKELNCSPNLDNATYCLVSVNYEITTKLTPFNGELDKK